MRCEYRDSCHDGPLSPAACPPAVPAIRHVRPHHLLRSKIIPAVTEAHGGSAPLLPGLKLLPYSSASGTVYAIVRTGLLRASVTIDLSPPQRAFAVTTPPLPVRLTRGRRPHLERCQGRGICLRILPPRGVRVHGRMAYAYRAWCAGRFRTELGFTVRLRPHF